MEASTQEYRTFAEFYPYYLSEHSNQTNRRLHFVGSSMAIGLLLAAITSGIWWLVIVAFFQGYVFAWIGHFFFEHNKPATFKYPFKSFLGDWKMYWQTLTGKIPF